MREYVCVCICAVCKHSLNMSARNIAITNYNIDIVTPDAEKEGNNSKDRENETEEDEQEKLCTEHAMERERERHSKNYNIAVVTIVCQMNFSSLSECVSVRGRAIKCTWQGAGSSACVCVSESVCSMKQLPIGKCNFNCTRDIKWKKTVWWKNLFSGNRRWWPQRETGVGDYNLSTELLHCWDHEFPQIYCAENHEKINAVTKTFTVINICASSESHSERGREIETRNFLVISAVICVTFEKKHIHSRIFY